MILARILLAGVLVTSTALSLQLQGSPPLADSSNAQNVTLLLAQANDFAQKYFDNQKALVLYAEALALESSNAEILWRISRSYVDIGEHLPTLTETDKERQLEMYEKALAFANRSVAVNPSSSMALTRRAIAISKVLLFKGLWESVGLMKDVRGDLEKAVSLDSTNHLAYYSLGTTHMKVIEKPWLLRWPLGLGWGSRTDAIRCYEKAVSIRSDFICYRLGSARAYVEEGENDKAMAHLTIIPMLETLDEDDELYRREARELLMRIKDEE